MQTTREAPIAEPQSISEPDARKNGGATVAIHGVAHAFADLRVLDGLEIDVARREVLGIVGPSGCGKSTLLELIAGLREPTEGRIAVGGAAAAGERLAGCAYMPQRDLLLPWLSAIDNAALALRNRGERREAARRAAAPLFERFGLARLRARAARGAVGRDAAAGRVPAHAAGGKAGAAARRAVRRPRRDHPRGDAGVARGRAWRARRAPSCSSPTTSRRRCTCPTVWSCCRRDPLAPWPSFRPRWPGSGPASPPSPPRSSPPRGSVR